MAPSEIKIDSICTKIVKGLLATYSLALISSMAAMEIFGWLSALIGGYCFLRRSWNKEEGWNQLGPDWYLWGLWAVAIAGASIHYTTPQSFLKVFGSFRWILSFYLIYFALQYSGLAWIKKWAPYFFVMTILVAAYAVSQRYTGIDIFRGQMGKPTDKFWRSTGLFSLPLTYAYSFSMLACMAFAAYLLHASRRHHRALFFLMCFSVISASVLSSYTRGAWIAVSVAFAFIVGKFNRSALVAYFVATAVIVGGLFTFNNQFNDRIMSSFDVANSGNIKRIQVWEANLAIFKDYPLLGIGFGENETRLMAYYKQLGIESAFYSHAHNSYLQFLSGTGLIGFLLYIGLCATLFVISLRLWRRIPNDDLFERSIVLGAMGAQIVVHVGGFTECNFKDFEVNHMFLAIMALVTVIANKYRVQKSLFPLNSPNSSI